MCAGCCAGNSNCPACRALVPATEFPFDESATLEQLLTHALRAYQREWQAGAMATLLYLLIVGGGTWFIGAASSFGAMALTKLVDQAWGFQLVALLQRLLVIPLQSLGSLGLMRMMLDVVQGRSPAPARFFGELRLMPRALLIQLAFSLVLATPQLASLLVTIVLPGQAANVAMGTQCLFGPLFLLFGLSWWLFSIPELLISDCTALQAMQRAWSLGSELRRFRVLGYAALAGALVLAGVLACFVGVFAGLPFAALILLSLFLALRNSSSLPAPTSL